MATIILEPKEQAALAALCEIPQERPRSGPQRGMNVSAREVADRIDVSFADADRVLRELARVNCAALDRHEGLDVFCITATGLGVL
jgi:hypothetical protein